MTHRYSQLCEQLRNEANECEAHRHMSPATALRRAANALEALNKIENKIETPEWIESGLKWVSTISYGIFTIDLELYEDRDFKNFILKHSDSEHNPGIYLNVETIEKAIQKANEYILNCFSLEFF